MTNDPRAQSQQSDVEWARAYADDYVDGCETNRRILAIADALETLKYENSKLAEAALERPPYKADLLVEIAASRAENAALAKLVDELGIEHSGFCPHACTRCDAETAATALRAGQQKGTQG